MWEAEIPWKMLTSEVLAGVIIQISFLWDVTPCSWIEICHRFGGM
jgi:hypothetical protein